MSTKVETAYVSFVRAYLAEYNRTHDIKKTYMCILPEAAKAWKEQKEAHPPKTRKPREKKKKDPNLVTRKQFIKIRAKERAGYVEGVSPTKRKLVIKDAKYTYLNPEQRKQMETINEKLEEKMHELAGVRANARQIAEIRAMIANNRRNIVLSTRTDKKLPVGASQFKEGELSAIEKRKETAKKKKEEKKTEEKRERLGVKPKVIEHFKAPVEEKKEDIAKELKRLEDQQERAGAMTEKAIKTLNEKVSKKRRELVKVKREEKEEKKEAPKKKEAKPKSSLLEEKAKLEKDLSGIISAFQKAKKADQPAIHELIKKKRKELVDVLTALKS